ncbi:PepSY-associated TM helix domain-containing protein [Leeia sp.]|uniref:PepSY-associated TM helix domain-containing protein n=1 Tax=Leeia sp. TaxID=2884678 RepID=UPI0035B243F0
MSSPRKTPTFYTVAWRWHFFAGLFVVPFMLMLACTGIIYLFKPQLDQWMYGELLNVPASSQPMHPADHLAGVVQQRYPGAALLKYQPPATSTSSSKLVIRHQGQKLGVYVDPYRATLLGSLDENSTLQAVVLKLHGELLMGKSGDLLVELAASWGVVLLVSGLYLWWPRGRGKLAVFWPRLSAGGRTLWRDLHAVTGFWGVLFVLFMLFSGLTWTGFWGEKFAAVWSQFPAQMWDDVPKSDRKALTLNSTEDKVVPWAVEQTPLPRSTGNHAEHNSQDAGSAASPASIRLQQVVDLAKARQVVPGYAISLPDGPEGVYTISVFPNDPRHEATLHVDQYSGKVLADIRFKDYAAVPKAVEFGVALHEGKFFGLANQLLMLTICLLIIFSGISGIIMWIKRKPDGKLGVPASPADTPLWKTALILMLLLGVAFPLVGASFLLVLALDALWQRLPRRAAA